MMEKQQTAVEWLWAKATNGYLSPEDFDKAKQMERERIEDAFDDGQANHCPPTDFNNGKDYYTQTYGQ